MPYKIRKVDGCKVTSPHGTKAKSTSKRKAERQVRLLRGVEHGMIPRRRRGRSK
jgi:hypothetical protein